MRAFTQLLSTAPTLSAPDRPPQSSSTTQRGMSSIRSADHSLDGRSAAQAGSVVSSSPPHHGSAEPGPSLKIDRPCSKTGGGASTGFGERRTLGDVDNVTVSPGRQVPFHLPAVRVSTTSPSIDSSAFKLAVPSPQADGVDIKAIGWPAARVSYLASARLSSCPQCGADREGRLVLDGRPLGSDKSDCRPSQLKVSEAHTAHAVDDGTDTSAWARFDSPSIAPSHPLQRNYRNGKWSLKDARDGIRARLRLTNYVSRNSSTAVVGMGSLLASLATATPASPPSLPGEGPSSDDATLALVLPILVLMSTLLFLVLLFLLFVLILRRRRGIELRDEGGPLDIGREEELEGEGGIAGVEERWLEGVDEQSRRGYQRAKDWQLAFPPNSYSTDITLSQFLTIQEKGVSAWSFEPDYESNPSVYVESRTELTFLPDGQGLAPEEGGGCSVMSNLPLPKLNEVYYWECKMFDKPAETNVSVGLATKPYPCFRLPGWNKLSVGYHSADGTKSHNYPFTAQSFGPAFFQGDVIGVGYRPRSGTVFFTRNGKKLDDAYIGLNRYNLFPIVGADGAATIHVNLGQAGFVFIEANVKKWGLAPMVGTLAPPPAYGSERGSILIETGIPGGREGGCSAPPGLPPPPPSPPPMMDPNDDHISVGEGIAASSGLASPSVAPSSSRSRRHGKPSHRRRRSSVNVNGGAVGEGLSSAAGPSTLPLPSSPLRLGTDQDPPLRGDGVGPSRLRESLPQLTRSGSPREVDIPEPHEDLRDPYSAQSFLASSRELTDDDDDTSLHNPPTPNLLDISLHSLVPLDERGMGEQGQDERGQGGEEGENRGMTRSLSVSTNGEGSPSSLSPSPRRRPNGTSSSSHPGSYFGWRRTGHGAWALTSSSGGSSSTTRRQPRTSARSSSVTTPTLTPNDTSNGRVNNLSSAEAARRIYGNATAHHTAIALGLAPPDVTPPEYTPPVPNGGYLDVLRGSAGGRTSSPGGSGGDMDEGTYERRNSTVGGGVGDREEALLEEGRGSLAFPFGAHRVNGGPGMAESTEREGVERRGWWGGLRG